MSMSKSDCKNVLKKLVILLFAIMLLGLFSQQNVEARAGGGGSGGSGGSSGGSGSSSSSSHYHDSNSRGRHNDPISSLINYIVIGVSFCGGAIIFTYKVQKAKKRSKQWMNYFAKSECNWNYREIQQQVKKAYFEVQECWRIQDASYAKDYMSEECYEIFRMKLEWIMVNNEEVVQQNVKLLSANPVFVHNDEGTTKDQIWYLIHGKMTGFYIDKDTRMLTRGNSKPEAFYEYWLFVYQNNKWVLDKIKQKNEMDLNQLIGAQG